MSKPDGASGLLQWSPSPSCGAYNYQYIFNLTWVRMEDGMVQAQQGTNLEDTSVPSSMDKCFGQTVTLTCTHPDPFEDPVKYLAVAVGFIENGEVLDFGDPATAQRFTLTRLNSTATTLFFTVTEEDHANVAVTCSCFLTLTGGGGREESNRIAIDVEETIQPPTLVSKPDSTSGLLQWNSPSSSSSCSNYQYNFTLTWVKIGDGSTGTVFTTGNRYDFTGGNYTATITAKIASLNLDESEPLNVTLFTTPDMTVSPQNVPATVAEGIVCLAALAAVSAVAGLFLIIIMVLSVILVGVLVRMRRRRREEGQERKRRDPGEANVPPVPMTTNPSYVQVQHSTEKKIPLYGNL